MRYIMDELAQKLRRTIQSGTAHSMMDQLKHVDSRRELQCGVEADAVSTAQRGVAVTEVVAKGKTSALIF